MSKKCEHHQDQECDCEGKCENEGCNCGEGCCGGGESGGGCSCNGGNHFRRHYQTKEEQIAELENYLKDLKLEVQAVEEHLTDLRK